MRGTVPNRTIRLASAAFMAAGLTLALFATPAYAYNEGGSVATSLTACPSCHPIDSSTATKTATAYSKGPHSGYMATSVSCELCHDIHGASSGSPKLLPQATVKATCESCHDGTGGQGVYGAIAARGLPVGAQHRIDTTRTVPGGNSVTGGSAVATFTGPGYTLSCDDCHSPHDAKCVNAFLSERPRVASSTPVFSDKLLKQQPTGASTVATEYGSDWCGGCHKGRLSGVGLHTHPVDSKLQTPNPFTYNNVAILSTDAPTAVTTMGPMGGVYRVFGSVIPSAAGNRGFLMPFPRTPQQGSHYPICQQCHGNARDVGSLSVDGGTADAASSIITSIDGRAAGDNPRFQTFPHQTTGSSMLVEEGDDLCTNCHPVTVLP